MNQRRLEKMKWMKKVSVILLGVTLLVGASGTKSLAAGERTLLWEDLYTNVDTDDANAPQPFDKASDQGDLSVYENTNEMFDKDTLTMILAPATKGYVTYDVSDVKFPEAQIQADVAFYADPALITNYLTIWTSENGTDFVQSSAKLLEEAADLGQGWYLCKVINFAAIPEGTKYIKIQLETPGQGWDIQLYQTAMYQIPADDINLTAPTLSLGDSKYPAQEAKDTMISILEATATDDVTSPENLEVSYTVTSPVDSQVVVNDGQFVLGMYGDYTITYTCMDEHGNMAKESFIIASVDKADLADGEQEEQESEQPEQPEQSEQKESAFPVWVIIAIVAVVVIVVILVIFVTNGKKKGKK